ncbi:MAG: hypothetical protein ACKOC8_09380 [Pirellulales bacterium]
MSRDAIEQYVWDRLPVSKHVAGRARVSRVVRRTLREWPIGVLRQCNDAECQVIGKHLALSIERQERAGYGMGFFGLVILSSIVSEIVKILIRRWLESSEAQLEIVEAAR